MAPSKPRIAISVPTSTDIAYNDRSWKQYAQAVMQAGAEPVRIKVNAGRKELQALFSTCNGVCLPGSPADVEPARYGADRWPATAPADPAREAVDFALLDFAAAESKPVLGICYGLQSLTVWSGGTLVQDLHVLPVNHSAGASVAVAHSVLVPADARFAAFLNEEEAPGQNEFLRLAVNSSHHQAVASPGEGLRVVARCPEDGVIEAVELDPEAGSGIPWLVGVQWHPERSTATSGASRALFLGLAAEATRASSRRIMAAR